MTRGLQSFRTGLRRTVDTYVEEAGEAAGAGVDAAEGFREPEGCGGGCYY